VVERAVILAAGVRIDLPDLPENLSHAPHATDAAPPQLGARVPLEEIENEHIRQVIARTSTMEEAATILGVDPTTLYRKRKKLGL
jgi:NtrC-family two-component system response regulator AlgB